MNVLITGASGNLASGVVESLEDRYELRLSDVAPVVTKHQFVQADVRRRDDLIRAAEGMDIILHTPAWHGIHLGSRTQSDFWELNVDGTFNLFQAAVANRVPKVVWISSMAVHSRDNIYGLSKFVGEELCQFYHRTAGIRCIMLRPADFTPYRNRKHYAERLLHGGVDRRDVIAAAVLAVANETVDCEAFAILRQDPWTPDDVQEWPHDPFAVLERYVCGARRLVERYGLSLAGRIGTSDITAANAKLGYEPHHNFITFLRELAERDALGDAAEWLQQR